MRVFYVFIFTICFILTTGSLFAQIETVEIELEDYYIEDAITDTAASIIDDETASGSKYLSLTGGNRHKFLGYHFSTTATTDTTYHLFYVSRSRSGKSYDREYINWDLSDDIIVPEQGADFPFQFVSIIAYTPEYKDSLLRKNWHTHMAYYGVDIIEINLQPGDHNFLFRLRDGSGDYDKIILTNDLEWRPYMLVEFEAEDISAISEPMIIEELMGASNDTIIATTPGSGTIEQTDFLNGNADIYFRMNQGADNFYVWLLVDFPSEASNSYWIGYGDEQVLPPHWEASVTDGFEWRQLTDENGTPKTYYAPFQDFGASQVIRVKQQEEGTRLDKILMTNDPDYIPTVTAISPAHQVNVVKEFSLKQNYPNPFNPTTRIDFNLPQNGNVKLSVYNLLGQKIATLLDTKMATGNQFVTWNARNAQGNLVSSGIYFYRIEFSNENISNIKTGKMILAK